MVRPERFELPTLWFVAKYSIQLSYGRTQAVSCETTSRLTGFQWRRNRALRVSGQVQVRPRTPARPRGAAAQ